MRRKVSSWRKIENDVYKYIIPRRFYFEKKNGGPIIGNRSITRRWVNPSDDERIDVLYLFGDEIVRDDTKRDGPLSLIPKDYRWREGLPRRAQVDRPEYIRPFIYVPIELRVGVSAPFNEESHYKVPCPLWKWYVYADPALLRRIIIPLRNIMRQIFHFVFARSYLHNHWVYL